MLSAHHSDDPSVASSAAERFLLSDPIAHNVVLGLLAQRRTHPEPGNYWWVTQESDVIGFAMQSPITFGALVVPAEREVVDPLARIMHETAPGLPGLMGDAATASRMAGAWTEYAGTGATPVHGHRIYEATGLVPPDQIAGNVGRATLADLDLLSTWTAAFNAETGSPASHDTSASVTRELAENTVWIWWTDDEPVAMAMAKLPVAGVSRVRYVYTPPEHRGRGYGAAVTYTASSSALHAGAVRCILYTQLSNPTSNSIYRKLGYEPVSEGLRYEFGA